MQSRIVVFFVLAGLIFGVACGDTPEVEQQPASASESQAVPAELMPTNATEPQTETPVPIEAAILPTETPPPTHTPVPTTTPIPSTATSVPTKTPAPPPVIIPTTTPEPIPTSAPASQPEPTATPAANTINPGTHRIGADAEPGLYMGIAGTSIHDSCYWARLSDLSGSFDSIVTSNNALGQFYVEVDTSDAALETDCVLSKVEEGKAVSFPIEDGLVPIGTYRIPDDLSPGLYRGEAGTDILDSCYWARLSDLSGSWESIITSDNALGQFYIEVDETDAALETDCALSKVEEGKAASSPVKDRLVPIGTYRIPDDLSPGLYRGEAGTDILDSCYWARLSDLSGSWESIITSDNALGQFYIEVDETDAALETDCALSKVEEGKAASSPVKDRLVPIGTYRIPDDLSPGLYRGEAGTDILDSCYWARLSDLSGSWESIITSDNAVGQFYIEVDATDAALKTDCNLTIAE